MKTVMITGASGFLGHNIIKALIGRGDTRIIAILGRPEDKANALPQSPLVDVYPCTDLFCTDFGHVDTLIHTAFSRGENLPGLASSLTFTEQIIEMVNEKDIDSIINISSQGIYKGLEPGEAISEDGPIEPNTAYGVAKWGVENMLKLGCRKSYTNIRLASLSANARFLDFFVCSVMDGKDITVTAPQQYASIMDVNDAVDAIISIDSLTLKKRPTAINVGPEVQYSILEYAQSANRIGASRGITPINIKVTDNGLSFAICMDCGLITQLTGWKAKITKDEMLIKMFERNKK